MKIGILGYGNLGRGVELSRIRIWSLLRYLRDVCRRQYPF